MKVRISKESNDTGTRYVGQMLQLRYLYNSCRTKTEAHLLPQRLPFQSLPLPTAHTSTRFSSCPAPSSPLDHVSQPLLRQAIPCPTALACPQHALYGLAPLPHQRSISAKFLRNRWFRSPQSRPSSPKVVLHGHRGDDRAKRFQSKSWDVHLAARVEHLLESWMTVLRAAHLGLQLECPAVSLVGLELNRLLCCAFEMTSLFASVGDFPGPRTQ